LNDPVASPPEQTSPPALRYRVGAALASPLGVLVIVPLLVATVGGFMAVSGQLRLRSSIDTMAEARFADQTAIAARHTEQTLVQADPLLRDFRALLDRHEGAPPLEEFARHLATLIEDRDGVSFLSFGMPNGDLLGVYLDDTGQRLLTERRRQDDGRRLLLDSLIPSVGPLQLAREDPDCGYDVRHRPFYEAAQERFRRTWTAPYVFFDSGVPGVTCAEPYLDPRGDFAGVLAVDFNLNALSEFVEGLPHVAQGRIFLFTDDGSLLAFPGVREEFRHDQKGRGRLLQAADLGDPVVDAFFAARPAIPGDSAEPVPFRFEQGDETILASVTPVVVGEDLTWYVGALAPRSSFMAPARAQVVASLRIAGQAIGVSILVAALFAWHVMRSRREVAQARAALRAAKKEVRELGSYRLVEKLGEGGMGEVWLGEHRMLARPAAIKLVHGAALEGLHEDEVAAALERFEREARVTSQLTSPYTVRLYDFGVSRDGIFFYVMELLDGLDLHDLIVRYGPQCTGRTVHILWRVCSSLAEAHDAGLVHRDIKPANVFLCRQGDDGDVVKVLDFGLVQAAGSEPSRSGGCSRSVAGTPAFMAPEQGLDRNVDRRTDLYAVGCLGYWLLTGKTVFVEDSATKVMKDHVYERPPPPSIRVERAIPQALDQLILSCLAKDRAQRPADARALRDLLERVPIPAEEAWDRDAIEHWWRQHDPRPSSPSKHTRPTVADEEPPQLQRGETREMPTELWKTTPQ